MKSPLILVTAALAARALADSVEPVIPEAFPAERYEALIARSPFALATPVAPPPVEPDKSFADGWFIGSVARFEGKDFVTVKARDLSTTFTLFGEEPTNGVVLKKVDWSSAIGRSTATIEKDGQIAKLEFNQAELQSAAAPVPMPGGAPRPGGPVGKTPSAGVRPSVPRPGQPVAQPQQYGGTSQPLNGTIPRPSGNLLNVVPPTNVGGSNQGVVTIPGAAVPQAAPDPRRRIRVINNAPAPQ